MSIELSSLSTVPDSDVELESEMAMKCTLMAEEKGFVSTIKTLGSEESSYS
jgi:hypothetical protein